MRRTTWFVGVGIVVVGAAGAAAQRGDITTAVPSRLSVKDPCEVAPAGSLKALLAKGLAPYFPISKSRDGEKVTVSEPSITDATCPNLKIAMKVSVRYQKTRGFPQLSVSGTARFTSRLDLRIAHPITIGSGQPIPAADVRSARACLTDINATELNINNVPNWFDNGWLREQVLEPLLVSKCVDVTDLVKMYIQYGGVVKAS
jgi:hypothetical protein